MNPNIFCLQNLGKQKEGGFFFLLFLSFLRHKSEIFCLHNCFLIVWFLVSFLLQWFGLGWEERNGKIWKAKLLKMLFWLSGWQRKWHLFGTFTIESYFSTTFLRHLNCLQNCANDKCCKENHLCISMTSPKVHLSFPVCIVVFPI